MPDSYKSIAISRQIGSGGSYIGYLAAKELGYKYLDREILREASTCLGTDLKLLEQQEEKSSGIIKNILRVFSLGAPDSYVPPVNRPVYDKDLFRLEGTIMNRMVDQFNSVILGRGGYYVLKDRPEVLRIFIHAPLEFRIKRLMEIRNNQDYRKIKSIIVESDSRRTKFAKDIMGVSWTDSRNFHLCVNSSATDFHTILEIIIRLMKK